MPIADNLKFDLQVTVMGTSATGGAGAKNVFNVFTYQRQSSVPAFSKLVFDNIFTATVLAPLAAAMNVRWTANGNNIRCLNDWLDPEEFFANILVGAIATDSLPLNAAVYLLYRTGIRGRNYRGSKHFSPASEIDTTQDILTGAGLARWQAVRTACAATLVDANGNNWVPTVYSRQLSTPNNLPVAIIEANPAVQVLLDLNIGNMKRRRSRTIR